jgi:hypothetical protein
MIIYYILTGLLPFNDIGDEKIKDKILNGETPHIPQNILPFYKNILKNCWIDRSEAIYIFNEFKKFLYYKKELENQTKINKIKKKFEQQNKKLDN